METIITQIIPNNGTIYLENFQYAHKEDFEFKFLHEEEKEMITVRVQPGDKILRIINKKNTITNSDMSYNNAFISSDESLEKQCMEIGR